MYRTKRFVALLPILMLCTSALLLSGCRLNCAAGNNHCQTGISPTYTSIAPTPRPTSALITDPNQAVKGFMDAYTANVPDYTVLFDYFDDAYKDTGRSAIACMGKQSRDGTGNFNSLTIDKAVVTDTVASVLVTGSNLVFRDRPMTFNLKKGANGGWGIDSIIGWISGDITTDTPVGENTDACLSATPTPGSGSTPASGGTTPAPGGTTPAPGGTTPAPGGTTPTP